jgi:hypothetical protein
MQIESFLAAREELGPRGFFLWGALIRVDGIVTWSGADCIGRGASCSVAAAQYRGAIEVLKKLGELRKAHPAATITMYAEKVVVEELLQSKGYPPREPGALLDEAIGLKHCAQPFMLRYTSTIGLRAAHELIDELCRRNGVNVERQVR